MADAKKLNAVVVGSGFGGLAAAVRLQALGVPTTLVEKRDKPGGRAYVYHDQGFTFDGGPTVITAPHCIEELFTLAGRNMADYVTLLPVHPFYRLLWEDGKRFDYAGGSEQLEAEVARFNPRDVENYRRFVAYSKRVFDKGYTELVDQPFLRLWDMVRVAPDLMRLRADRSVYKTVCKFVEDPHLRQAFSFHSLLVGGNPLSTSAIYTLIHYLERNWGVFFPKGGTGALVQGLVNLFVELGGTLRLNAAVSDIAPAGGTKAEPRFAVKLEDGTALDAGLVVSNADVLHTYKKLLGGVPVAAGRARKLERMNWSMSLFVLYFGTDRTYRDDVAHHTICFGKRYEGLLKDIFRGKQVPDDFSLYLHAPTVTDPSLAPAGCDAFYVLSPVPHLGNTDPDWPKFAEIYADRVLAYLERYLPELRKHVVVRRHFTPQDYRDVYNTHLGSAFSVAPDLTQSAWFRPHNKDGAIPGLYFVGAGTHPGAGVPGVINSAKATVRLIREDFKL